MIPVRTICGQDDSDVLLAEGADSEQHGWSLGGDEAQGHVLSGSAVRGGGGGLRASVLHHWEGLLEGVGDGGLSVEGHRHLCADTGKHKRRFQVLIQPLKKNNSINNQRDKISELLQMWFIQYQLDFVAYLKIAQLQCPSSTARLQQNSF